MLTLAFVEVRAAGEFVESVINAMLDAVIGAASEMPKPSQSLALLIF